MNSYTVIFTQYLLKLKLSQFHKCLYGHISQVLLRAVEWAPEAIKFSKSYGSHLIALTRYIFKFGSHIFLFLQSDASRPFQKLFSNFVLPNFFYFFRQKQMKLFSRKLLRLARFFRLPGSKSESLLFAFWFLMRLGLVYLNFLSLCALPLCHYFRQHKVLIVPSRDGAHGFYVFCPLCTISYS